MSSYRNGSKGTETISVSNPLSLVVNLENFDIKKEYEILQYVPINEMKKTMDAFVITKKIDITKLV